MQRTGTLTLGTLALLVVLVCSALPRADLTARVAAAEPPPEVGADQVASSKRFLPIVARPPAAPQFAITSPAAGSSIAGTLYFAVQPASGSLISQVAFKAGTTNLGTDTTPADGFRVFLNARSLPAGQRELSATATGPGGTTTQTVAVTVVPNPPASATIGASGGVVGTQIGSALMVPPGALPNGTNVSVTEKSQQQVTAETGINWDALGVTFLGAQDVQTSADFARPLAVSSAGFGNRVQPGQAVVNYRIAPDADGDGIGELVAVNTASVAPNNDVISDPIAPIFLGVPSIGLGTRDSVQAQQSTPLTGPPGTPIVIAASGFNPLSPAGNVATFRSSVNNAVVDVPVPVRFAPGSPSEQIVIAVIPILPAGAATLTLRNQSTGATADAIAVTVEPAVPINRPAATIIDEALAGTLDDLNALKSKLATLPVRPDVLTSLTEAANRLAALRTLLQQTSQNPTADERRVLDILAILLQSYLTSTTQARAEAQSPDQLVEAANCDFEFDEKLVFFMGFAGAFSVAGGIASLEGLAIGLSLSFFGAGLLIGMILTIIALGLIYCEDDPPPCEASPGGGGGMTGMGSLPPPGGPGCGGAGGGPSAASGSGLRAAALPESAAGRYIVKIYPRSGTGRPLTPFTGVSDAGGYFFIPLIPAGEPFRAIAIDTVTEAQRTFDGIGPPLGQSVYMNFVFSPDDVPRGTFPIAIGDTVSDGVPAAGAGNLEQRFTQDRYTFTAAAGQTVYFDFLGVTGRAFLARFTVTDSTGTVLAEPLLSNPDPGAITLTRGGTYTIIVNRDRADAVGTYSFKLWNVPVPQQFAIAVGDTVSNGVPAAGAGNLETPGVEDIYTFTAVAGQSVYVDYLSITGSAGIARFTITDSTGAVVADPLLSSPDPGAVQLVRGGSYTISVNRTRAYAVGTYSFQIRNP